MSLDHTLHIPTLHAEDILAEVMLLSDDGHSGGLRWLWLMVHNWSPDIVSQHVFKRHLSQAA